MEKSLKEIIKEVGKEYDLEDDIINDIIKKLQKEFYIKLKHMKNLSIDTWKSLELPINLYYVLNELYQSALSEQQQSNPQPKPQQNIQTSPIEPIQNPVPQQKSAQIQNKIPTQQIYTNNIIQNTINQMSKQINKNQIQGNNSLQNIVNNDLCILFAEIDNLDISRKVFKSIYTVISNIAHNPNNEKCQNFFRSKIDNSISRTKICLLMFCCYYLSFRMLTSKLITVDQILCFQNAKEELGYEPQFDCQRLFEAYKKEMQVNRFKALRDL